MAPKPGSKGNGRYPLGDEPEISTLADVWPPSSSTPSATPPGGKRQRVSSGSQARSADPVPQSMAPRNARIDPNARRRVLNGIEPSRPPLRAADDMLARATRYAQAQAERYVNEPAPQRPSAQVPLSVAPLEQPSRAPVVPEELQSRYVRQGRDWYTTDGALAFSVRNDRLTTHREDRNIVKDLVLAAERNGWTEVTVTGSERWRRRAWREATLVGVQVKGYDPSPRERQQVIRDIARQSALLAGAQAPGAAADSRDQMSLDFPESAPPSMDAVAAKPNRSSRQTTTERNMSPRSQGRRLDTETMEGQLVKHGEAPYRFHSDQSPSYFATVLTADGERTFWGVGLKEAIEKSESQVAIGDRVVLRRVGKTPVTVKLEELAADGRLQKVSIDTERVEWRVERPEWFVNRAQQARLLRDDQLAARRAAREDPELARAMLSLRAGELLAEERLSDPKRREQFIREVAKRLERETGRGRPAPEPRLRARAPARSGSARDTDPREREPDLEPGR